MRSRMRRTTTMKLTRIMLIVATLAMEAAQTTRTTRSTRTTTIGTMVEKMKTTTLRHSFAMKN